MAFAPPLGPRAWTGRLPGSSHQLYLNAVDSSYFTVMRLPVLRGRTFLPAEQDGVIVSESAARTLWPNDDPLGKITIIPAHGEIQRRACTVVGVVKDSGANTVDFPDSVEVYPALDDQHLEFAKVVVHTKTDPAPLLGVADSVASLPGLQSTTSSMQHDFDQRAFPSKVIGSVVGLLGSVATLLAAIGIFGLVAFTVSQRTREIGVRMALGARVPDILGTVLAQYAVRVGAGTITGVAMAGIVARVLRHQVIGIELFDPAGYAAGVLLFALIAFAASLTPARRALSIEPASALRYE